MNFWEQLLELQLKSPRLYNINVGCENSEYCTHSDKNKNCYLVFQVNFCEDCLYGGLILESRDCTDCQYCEYSELCYECVDCDHCYNCNFSQDIKNCHDCYYCYDCMGCKNCFGCVGLRQKEYQIYNEAVSKEKFEKFIRNFSFDERFEKLKQSIPRKYMHESQTQRCTGDQITESKNCLYCFDTHNSEDSMYLQDCWNNKDNMDVMFSWYSELLYESFSIGLNSYNCNFCNYVRTSSNLEYCELCFNCKDCFGCIDLKNKQYYILNQPYSKEEYFKKVEEIKEEMRRNGTYGKHLPTTYKWEDTAAAM